MRGQATLTKDEAEKLVQSACAAMSAELARLRAELDAAPTATLRQQLAGSQSALSKVMGELTEAREQLERRRIDYAKVQADLYNQIEAEKAQTVEAYRQRDVARAALAEAERERDEARGQSGKWKRAARMYREELRTALRDEFAGEFGHLIGPELWEATSLEADQWTGRWSRQRRDERQAGKE